MKILFMPASQEIFWRLLLAVFVGGLIGAEREYRSKSAGFRTLTLICLGAALFTMFSELIGARNSPERIASNIVVGIGFVGAGVIFKGENRVNGITTAAMIWVTAALGMGIGAGYLLISLLAAFLVLAVLLLFSFLEGWIDRINQIRDYRIVCDYDQESLHRFEAMFKTHKLKFKRSRQSKTANTITGEWIVHGSAKNHRQFINAILADPDVKAFDF